MVLNDTKYYLDKMVKILESNHLIFSNINIKLYSKSKNKNACAKIKGNIFKTVTISYKESLSLNDEFLLFCIGHELGHLVHTCNNIKEHDGNLYYPNIKNLDKLERNYIKYKIWIEEIFADLISCKLLYKISNKEILETILDKIKEEFKSNTLYFYHPPSLYRYNIIKKYCNTNAIRYMKLIPNNILDKYYFYTLDMILKHERSKKKL